MFVDDDFPFLPRPFWFASDALLTDLLVAEVAAVSELLTSYPDIRKLCDEPEATVPQRKACFEILAHRMVMDVIYETFAGRYQESPSLGVEEEHAIGRTQNLVASDAPAWTLEVERVVAKLPFHICNALPEPLRVGGVDANNVEQVEGIKVAAATLGSVEQIQALIHEVLDKRRQRLQLRWSTAVSQAKMENQRKGSKRHLRGTAGLTRKNDLSRYMHGLTEKQQLALSLKLEYGLGLTEIAQRMEVDRKTAYEHIQAAVRNIDQVRSNEKGKTRSSNTPE